MSDPTGTVAWFAQSGTCSALIRELDWSKTPLGPMASWSRSLKTTVATVLSSRHPMFLWWGRSLTQLYNDAYLPSLGVGKHPAAMGQSGRECWQETWSIIFPQIEAVMTRGEASWHEDQLIPILRNHRIEDVYWTYGYSPVFDDDGSIGGTLVVCTETTARVLAERRQKTLRELMAGTSLAESADEINGKALAAIEQATSDIPFAAAYTLDLETRDVRLARATGLPDEVARVLTSALTTELRRADAAQSARDLSVAALPSQLASRVFVAPLALTSTGKLQPFVVFGVSPRLSFDEKYREFFEQLAQQLLLSQARIAAAGIRMATEGERNNLLLQAPVPTAVMVGPDHVFQLANPLYCQMVGRKDIVGRKYVEAFPELVDTALPGILDRVFTTGEPFVTNELLVPLDRRGDGKVEDAYFKFNLEAMRDLEGRVYGMMAVAMEITEQVEARRGLEKTQREREKLLGELEAASRTKDEFLAMLSHEMRNPLAPIVSALDIMKSSATVPEEHAILSRHVSHLVRLVDDLLDISKVTRGKIELLKQTVDLSDVLARAVEMASFLIERRGHQLTIVHPPGIMWNGDPVRLAQAVSNLLTNAARYTPEHGHIRLSASRNEGDVVISVKDNGKGMSAELLPRVFDLFLQGPRNIDRAEGGLGIGLSLVKSLVELHGGSVTAHSDGLGKGSEFVLRLPAPAVDAVKEPRPVAVSVATGAKRVLVVDDNTDAAELLAMLLQRIGHQVEIANEPLAALEVAARFKPDVAVLDIGLPHMDGYELAQRLRAGLVDKSCRLIALTGYGREDDRARSAAAGFDEHLVKPVDLAKLVSIFGRAAGSDRAAGSGRAAGPGRANGKS